MTDLRRKNGANLPAVEREARARFVCARLKQGASYGQIARELEIAPETLRQWWTSYQTGAPSNSKPKAAAEKKDAPCVTCGRQFRAERADGAWERMCPSCRSSAPSVVFHGLAHDGRKGRAR